MSLGGVNTPQVNVGMVNGSGSNPSTSTAAYITPWDSSLVTATVSILPIDTSVLAGDNDGYIRTTDTDVDVYK